MNKYKKEIELVIFDLGKVILDFDHMITCRKLAEYSKRDSTFIYDFIFKSGLEENYEKGKISSRQLFEAVSDKIGLKMSFKDFNLAWSDIFSLNKGIDQLVSWVKTKAKTAILSNTDEMHFNYIRDKYEIINDFDFTFLSYEIGYMKPEKEIFEYAVSKAGILPRRIIFIDDIQEFACAANKSGINGICFKDVYSLRKELEDYFK